MYCYNRVFFVTPPPTLKATDTTQRPAFDFDHTRISNRASSVTQDTPSKQLCALVSLAVDSTIC